MNLHIYKYLRVYFFLRDMLAISSQRYILQKNIPKLKFTVKFMNMMNVMNVPFAYSIKVRKVDNVQVICKLMMLNNKLSLTFRIFML